MSAPSYEATEAHHGGAAQTAEQSSLSSSDKLDHSKEKNLEAGPGGVSAVHQDAAADVFASLREDEAGHDIKLRTMSWQKTAVLLFGEYVCLAIMAQAWSYSILGYFPGLLVTLVMGLVTLYTSYVLWQFTMQQTAKGNRCLDICDIGYLLFNKSQIAYEATAIMLLLNNIFLMGFHVLTGARILNTLSDGSLCTTTFSVIITLISIVFSIPRTLNHVSLMSWVSAGCMAIAILLCMIFAGIESNPAYGYGGAWPLAGDRVYSRAFAEKGTTFVNGTNAFLNITFLWIGQILYPTFIAEMERPQDFPKALYALTVAEFILFAVPAVVIYRYTGQYTTAPAFGSLQTKYKKASFAFVIVPTIIIGVIYAHVAAKYIFNRIMRGNRHTHSHTVVGWGTWLGVMVVCWFLAFVIGSVIPSFGDFLSIMSAAFDSSFGGFFWCLAYWHMNRDRLWSSPLKILTTLFNIFIFALSAFMLGPGLYTSIDAIIADYAGPVKHPFVFFLAVPSSARPNVLPPSSELRLQRPLMRFLRRASGTSFLLFLCLVHSDDGTRVNASDSWDGVKGRSSREHANTTYGLGRHTFDGM